MKSENEVGGVLTEVVLGLVTMERPAPDSQSAGCASDRERTAAQSRTNGSRR
jgi:hypothetical protein